jgi:hypothetical protein
MLVGNRCRAPNLRRQARSEVTKRRPSLGTRRQVGAAPSFVQPVLVFPGWQVEPMDLATQSALWVLEPKQLPGFIGAASGNPGLAFRRYS